MGMVDVVDTLFHLDDPHHQRRRRKSRRYEDLQRLCAMLNGDLMTGELTHFCWDPATGEGCCSDRDECVGKVVFACSCALFGEADPVPCESRWANLLSNKEKTLLRRCAYKLGILAFGSSGHGHDVALVSSVEVDAAAGENYFEIVNRSRLSKTRAYFEDPRSMPELVVCTAALDIIDFNMLYPFLGDAVQEDAGRQVLPLLASVVDGLGRGRSCPPTMVPARLGTSAARGAHVLALEPQSSVAVVLGVVPEV